MGPTLSRNQRRGELQNSSCCIDDLADEDLLNIFKRLPPLDRLRLSEVSKRWRDLTRMAWLNITHLDLSTIPGPNVGTIIRLCPNLQTVFAQRKTFDRNELRALARAPLSSVTLLACGAFIGQRQANDVLSAVFSSDLPGATWSELSLSDFKIIISDDGAGDKEIEFRASFPAPIKRLQLTDLTCIFEHNRRFTVWGRPWTLFYGLGQREHLECLMLNSTEPDNFDDSPILLALNENHFYDRLGALTNLRELYLGAYEAFAPKLRPIFKLSKLEVLFLHNINVLGDANLANFKKLACEHPTLRVLVLTGGVNMQIELPPRPRYPNGLGSDPAPLLHLFMDDKVSEMIRFSTAFLTHSVRLYRIDEPLPEFLEREEVKPVFDGVWVAAKIKETKIPPRMNANFLPGN